MTTDAHDEDLLAATGEGLADAVAAIYERHRAMVYVTAYHHLRRREDALDVTQVVFLRLVETLAAGEVIANLSGWLYRVARNDALNRLRAVRVAGRKHEQDPSALERLHGASRAVAPDRTLEARDELQRVRQAVERLPANQREIVALCVEQEMDQRSVARLLGLAEDSVKVLLYRARRALAASLRGRSSRGGG